MKLSALLLVLLPLVLAGGASGEAAGESGPQRNSPIVAASNHPVAMLVEEIAGDRVSITTIVPPGVDPHHFELTPSSARAAMEADAVFLIGADFDSHYLGGKQRDDQVRLEFCEYMADSLIELGRTFNPHFWLDPLLAAEMGKHIGEALIAMDGAGRGYYEKRMVRFAERMDSLHVDIKERLAAAGFRSYVAFHPAWTYFARRYGLTEVGVIEKYPEHEPSAKWIANLVREIDRRGVRVLIVEEASDPGVVRGIADDTGAKVLVLDPIGDPEDPRRSDYFGLMNYNVSLIELTREGD